jgi:hypothetical protein
MHFGRGFSQINTDEMTRTFAILQPISSPKKYFVEFV